MPHLLKQNWNHYPLSELLTKVLNFNTNKEIRLKRVELACILINAGKDTSYHPYIKCLSFTAKVKDFAAFIKEHKIHKLMKLRCRSIERRGERVYRLVNTKRLITKSSRTLHHQYQ